MKQRDQVCSSGFTVLELMCVLAIIAILAGLILGAIGKARTKADELSHDVGQGQTNIMKMQEPGGLLSPD